MRGVADAALEAGVGLHVEGFRSGRCRADCRRARSAGSRCGTGSEDLAEALAKDGFRLLQNPAKSQSLREQCSKQGTMSAESLSVTPEATVSVSWCLLSGCARRALGYGSMRAAFPFSL